MGTKRMERLEQVKALVLAKGAVTAQELADELGTSRRTIYRYVERLRQKGLHIEACPGSTGGFRISQSRKDNDFSLTDEESIAILLAGAAVCENSLLPFNGHLETALEKTKRSLSRSAWAELQETMPNVSVMVEKLCDYHEADSHLEQITEAIANKHKLRVAYYSLHRDVQEEREIDPYHLFYQGGAWYVIGYCHLRKDVRTFRVDRIKRLSIMEERFERPHNFSLYGYLGSAWGIMRGQRNIVKIRFLPPVSRLIAESQWHPTQQIEARDDGSIIFTAEVDGLIEIRRWVLTFAELAEVLEPQELRTSIERSIAQMINLYCGGQPYKALAELDDH